MAALIAQGLHALATALDAVPRSVFGASLPGSCSSCSPPGEGVGAACPPCPGGSAGSQYPFSATAASSMTGSCWIAAAAMLMASSRLCWSSNWWRKEIQCCPPQKRAQEGWAGSGQPSAGQRGEGAAVGDTRRKQRYSCDRKRLSMKEHSGVHEEEHDH